VLVLTVLQVIREIIVSSRLKLLEVLTFKTTIALFEEIYWKQKKPQLKDH